MKTVNFTVKGRSAYLEDKYFEDEIKAFLSYFHPSARFSMMYNRRDEDGNRLWDGKVSMLKKGKLPIGLLLGAYKELKDAGFKVHIRRWKHRPSVRLKKGQKESDPHRSYQNKATSAIIRALPKGGGTLLAATGSGKTRTAALAFSHIVDPCLFIVDQVNLLYQTQKELGFWLKENIGIVGHGKFEPRRITVATIQTLHARKKDPRFKKWMGVVKVIFIDELHKQMSRRNFLVIDLAKPEAVFGLTATLQMHKKMIRWKVYSISGPVIFEYPAKEGIEQGVLSRCSAVQVTVPEVDEDDYGDLLEDYKSGSARRYMSQVVYSRHARRATKELVKSGLVSGYAIIVLAERIKHVRLLRRSLERFKPRAVYGAVEEETRQKIIAKFEKGKCNLIIASSVFTKGVNLKRISLIIEVSQRKSKNDALQKLGRGLRKFKGKKGLVYVFITTIPAMKAAGSSQRNAIKKAGIPVATLAWNDTTADKVLGLGKELMQNGSTKKHKQKR